MRTKRARLTLCAVLVVAAVGLVFAQPGVTVNGVWNIPSVKIGGSTGALLTGDAADVLAQRNGTTAQTFRLYNTFTDASNYARAELIATGGSGAFVIGNRAAGSGVLRALTLRGDITAGTGWTVSTTNNLVTETDNAVDIGATGATRPRAIFLGQSAITAGSGTGVTINDSGSVRTQVYKVTVTYLNCIANATTCDVTLATLPAKTFVTHILVDLTTTYACTATCTSTTLSATVGKTSGGNQYILSFDADAATDQFGDAAAELGASLAPATIATGIGDLASWTATTAVNMRLTSAVGNLGNGSVTNLSQGSATYYIYTTVEP